MADSIKEERSASAEWREMVAKYQEPSTSRALWQMTNTLVPYAALWGAMYWARSVSWWLVIPLAVLGGGFLIRIFIIFHDCGHGSYFKARWANDLVGFITGVLTLTPYYHWRWEHGVHHATSGHLDKRGVGDIWTMTVQEYLEASPARRVAYRLARNPFILFGLAPIWLFLFRQRWPSPGASPRERHSVHAMNLAVLGMAVSMSLVFGWLHYVILQSIILMVGGGLGIWLFYVQHQFEGVYWERGKDWDYTQAALQGSSFYKLPKVLQWFSGNIGFHHIHHLSPRIPNYNLERCHRAHPLFQQVPPVTLRGSLKSLAFRLWDEHQHKLISFRQLRPRIRRARRFPHRHGWPGSGTASQ